MNRPDRIANIGLLVGALAAWTTLAYVLLNLDPRSDATALLAGALLIGGATWLSLTPLLWLFGFVRNRRIAYRGDWWRATRRAALIGLVVLLIVILRGQGALSVPLALFVVAMGVLVELTLSLRR